MWAKYQNLLIHLVLFVIDECGSSIMWKILPDAVLINYKLINFGQDCEL